MLHVVNGESTLELLKQSPITGSFLVWKEMLMEGPVLTLPNGGVDWKARAAFLKKRFGIESKAYLANIKIFFDTLTRASESDTEVTFWFEEDFFCQIHLIFLLTHLPEPLLAKGRINIICPEKSLAIRQPSSMERLFNARSPLAPAKLTLSRKVWTAFAQSTPEGWSGLLKWTQSGSGFAAWPLLQKSLRCHLARRPNPDGGPNPLETAMLLALSQGPLGFSQFFRRTWSEPQVHPLGMGDMQIARCALDFAAKPNPLLVIKGPGNSPAPGTPIITKGWKLHLTAAGKSIFAHDKPKLKSRLHSPK